jgi:hypothetical protein
MIPRPSRASEATLAPQAISCTPAFELPEEISFLTAQTFEGKVRDKANCGVTDMQATLGSELREKLSISTDGDVVALQSNDGIGNNLPSFITGFAVDNLNAVEIIVGSITLQWAFNGQLFSQQLPIKVQVFNPTAPRIVGSGAAGLGLSAVVLVGFLVRRHMKLRRDNGI